MWNFTSKSNCSNWDKIAFCQYRAIFCKDKEKLYPKTFNYAINFGMPLSSTTCVRIQCLFNFVFRLSNKILLPDVKLKAQWDIGSQEFLLLLPLSSSSYSQPPMVDAIIFFGVHTTECNSIWHFIFALSMFKSFVKQILYDD